jgi:hypothetical protein
MTAYLSINSRPSLSAADAAALRAGISQQYGIGQFAVLSGSRKLFFWDPASAAADDGTTVIKPDDIAGPNPGRFLVVGDTAATPNTYALRDGAGGLTVGAFTATDLFANSLNRPVGGAGTLSLGTSVDNTAITLGRAAITVTIPGNLTVQGTTTTIDSTVVDIKDRVVHVNHTTGIVPVPINITGLLAERGSADGITPRNAAGIVWDEATSSWHFAFITAADDLSLGDELALRVGPLAVADTAGTAARLDLFDGQSAAVSAGGSARLRYDDTIGAAELSEDGGIFRRVRELAWENVLDHGAVDDNNPASAMANRVAIVAAIAAALAPGGSGVVYFPRVNTGVYYVDATLVGDDNLELTGPAFGRAAIIGTSIAGPVIQGSPTPAYSTLAGNRTTQVTVRNLRISNTSKAAAGGVGIDFRQVSYGLIDNCSIDNVQTGVLIGNVAYNNRIVRVSTNTCLEHFVDENGANGTVFESCHAIPVAADTAFLIQAGADDDVSGIKLYDCSAEGTGAFFGVDIVGSAPQIVKSVHIQKCRFEGDTAGAIAIRCAATEVEEVWSTENYYAGMNGGTAGGPNLDTANVMVDWTWSTGIRNLRIGELPSTGGTAEARVYWNAADSTLRFRNLADADFVDLAADDLRARSLDRLAGDAGALTVGGTTATSLTLGRAAITTQILGTGNIPAGASLQLAGVPCNAAVTAANLSAVVAGGTITFTGGASLRYVSDGAPFIIERNHASTGSVLDVLYVRRRNSGGGGTDGIGASIEFESENDADSIVNAASIRGLLVTAAAATREGAIDIFAPRSTDQVLTRVVRFRGGDVNGPKAIFGGTAPLGGELVGIQGGRLFHAHTSTSAAFFANAGGGTVALTIDTTNFQLLGNSVASGTVPRWSFDGDADTGVGRSAADTLELIVGGGTRLTLKTAQIEVPSGVSLFVNATATLAGALVRIRGLAIVDATSTTAFQVAVDGGATVALRIDTSNERIHCGATKSAVTPRIGPYDDTNTGIGFGAADEINLITNGATRLRFVSDGRGVVGSTSPIADVWFEINPPSQSSGGWQTFRVSPDTLTGQTASVEIITNYFAGHSVTKAAGDYTNQRFFWIERPTYDAAAATRVTHSATVAIENAPAAGSANFTIDNPYALWVMAGLTRLAGDVAWDACKIKVADEGISSDNTLSNDADLGMPLQVGKYLMLGVLFISQTSATPDFIFDFAAEGGLVVSTYHRFALNWTFVGGTPTLNSGLTMNGIDSAITFDTRIAGENASQIVLVWNYVEVTTAGTMRFRWSQGTSDAATTTLKEGSCFIPIRIR